MWLNKCVHLNVSGWVLVLGALFAMYLMWPKRDGVRAQDAMCGIVEICLKYGKVLMLPLILSALVFIIFFTIVALSKLSDIFAISARLRFITKETFPIIKDIVWPVVFFSIMCVYRGELAVLLSELRRLVSNVSQISAGSVVLTVGKDAKRLVGPIGVSEGDAKKNSENEPEMGNPNVDIGSAIVEFCMKDAKSSFGLVLQKGVTISVGTRSLSFPWADTRGKECRAVNYLCVNDKEEIFEYLDKVNKFVKATKLDGAVLSLLLYVIWKDNAAIPVNLTYPTLFPVKLKHMTEQDCLRGR